MGNCRLDLEIERTPCRLDTELDQSIFVSNLLSENGFDLLQENGDLILLELNTRCRLDLKLNPDVGINSLLQENGFDLLQENGDLILLEIETVDCRFDLEIPRTSCNLNLRLNQRIGGNLR